MNKPIYQSNFNQLLNTNKLPRNIMLFGESTFLINYYFKIIRSVINADEVFIFYEFEFEPEKAIELVSQGSLFSEKTLLVLKSEKKIKKQDLTKIINAVSKVPTSYFVYIYLGNDFKSSFSQFLTQNSTAVRFFHPKSHELINYIQQFISGTQKKGFNKFKLTPKAINYLIYLKQGNLELIENEIEKLANYEKNIIDENDIKEAIANSNDLTIDKAIEDFLLTGKYENLLNLDEMLIITYFNRFFNEVFKFRLAFELNQNTSSKAVLGYQLPVNIENQKQNIWRKFNLRKIAIIIDELTTLELKFKTGKVGDKQSLLIKTILKLRILQSERK
jgi:DNA polymerase-3 subunit delta